ncbi:MAG: 4-alpha-glucanotransferase [archaeon]
MLTDVVTKFTGNKRAFGIIAHPTQFADPLGFSYGIGELGSAVLEWIDFLHQSNTHFWQVLPLGHTHPQYGNSPYQSFSRFAGDPNVISIEHMLRDGYITQDQHDRYSHEAYLHKRQRIFSIKYWQGGFSHALWEGRIGAFFEERIDYEWILEHKLGTYNDSNAILRQAYRNCVEGNSRLLNEFHEWVSQQGDWLSKYAEFMGIREIQNFSDWVSWSDEYKDVKAWRKNKESILQGNQKLAVAIDFYKFEQFLFFKHWGRIREFSRDKGVNIIGDFPIGVAPNSADVWANPDLFILDESGSPQTVMGYLPDRFSKTGQKWGMPLFNLEKPETIEWLADSVVHYYKIFGYNLIRFDHFQGVVALYGIPYDKDPIKGKFYFVPGAGEKLMEKIKVRLLQEKIISEGGSIPFIVEYFDGDANVPDQITTEVQALLKDYGFPIMSTVQTDAMNGKNLANKQNTALYTGTHDNMTAMNFMRRFGNLLKITSQYSQAQKVLSQISPKTTLPASWIPIAMASQSEAALALCMYQDVFGISQNTNYPGHGNSWMARAHAINYGRYEQVLAKLNQTTNR